MTDNTAHTEGRERLEAIKVRADKASEGPWVWADSYHLTSDAEELIDSKITNRIFIAFARTDIPWLITALEEAWAALQAERERSSGLAEELGRCMGEKYLLEQGRTERITLEFEPD